MATYYLIDYENVHDSDLWGIDRLNYDDCVIIFYTIYANRINLDVLQGIQASLRVIRVPVGNQSLDRHLISYLGFLIGQDSDPESRFQVISKDNGYRKIIEFWNRWFNMDDKVCQRARIAAGQDAVSEPAPYFTSDGRAMTAQGTQLRRAVMQYMRANGERSQHGHWRMMVSTLCTYLNSLQAYQQERDASGKKPLQFLQQELSDILMIRHEQSSDYAYLITDQQYWDQPEGEPLPEPAEQADEPVIQIEAPAQDESEAEPPISEVPAETIAAIVRATFENDAEQDDAGRRRVKASLLRDRLEKLDGYRLARQASGQKPLQYMAQALDDVILIRVIKSRSWAYLLDDEPSALELTEDDLAIPGEEPPRSAFEQKVYQQLIADGRDTLAAASVAAIAADALLTEQPKASFHARLWQQFGQKLGTRYYRQVAAIFDEAEPSSDE